MCRKDSHECRPFLVSRERSAASTSELALHMKRHAIESKNRRLPFYKLIRSLRKNSVLVLFICLFFVCLKIGYQIGTNLADADEDNKSKSALRKPPHIQHHHHQTPRHEKRKHPPQQQQIKNRPVHPYEVIWPGLTLPNYMIKDPQYDVEAVPADKKACFVHVGKTAGSTVGCSLGFNLHCESKVQSSGFLVQNYTTNMFHAQIYDCDDETTTFFIFVVRHPLDRWISAFNYDNPSKNWELFRKQYGEKHFNFRSQLYAECPFNTVDDIGKALSAESNVTDVCKRRAEASIDGTQHFGCHHFFNYQFHLEAIPENATIMTLRTEHLVEDWNSVEYNLGGKEVLGQENKVIAHNNVNKASSNTLKYLSVESRRLICAKLCNEIQNYKKILRLSINLSDKHVQQSIDELSSSCPIEALTNTCNIPMPNITEKLMYGRGYIGLGLR